MRAGLGPLCGCNYTEGEGGGGGNSGRLAVNKAGQHTLAGSRLLMDTVLG